MVLGAVGIAVGSAMGSTGWAPWWSDVQDPITSQIVWDIRLPRSLGAWAGGALLGLAGALAQGLFRNPLADPYLLGSASGASLGVAIYLSLFGGSVMAMGWWVKLGMTGAAFVGAVLAVMLTLLLARGVQHTLRLLLAGVVVGVVLGAFTSLVTLLTPDILPALAELKLVVNTNHEVILLAAQSLPAKFMEFAHLRKLELSGVWYVPFRAWRYLASLSALRSLTLNGSLSTKNLRMAIPALAKGLTELNVMYDLPYGNTGTRVVR